MKRSASDSTAFGKNLVILTSAVILTIVASIFPPWIATRKEVNMQVFGIVQTGDVVDTSFVGFRFIDSDATRVNLMLPFGGTGSTQIRIFWPLLIGEWSIIWIVAARFLYRQHRVIGTHLASKSVENPIPPRS